MDFYRFIFGSLMKANLSMSDPREVSTQFSPAPSGGAHRSGVAARLAGVPVETLRVWERRYGISSPQRSPRGQRLYSDEDVRRLTLIKMLVDQGHSISAVARLPIPRLLELATPHARQTRTLRPLKLAIVGEVLARQIASGMRLGLGMDVVRTCSRLATAPEALREAAVDVVLIDVPELNESVLPDIQTTRDATGASAVVVLYRFCASATIAQLRKHGCLVARAPADAEELALLCDAALAVNQRLPKMPVEIAPAPRRLSDDALIALAIAPNKIGCECPRHLAEILMTLGSFERYSSQCAASNPSDALLHQLLNDAASRARTVLEAAMEMLARAEGLPLPAELQPNASDRSHACT